jgi:hypothetical protein
MEGWRSISFMALTFWTTSVLTRVLKLSLFDVQYFGCLAPALPV